MKNLKSFVGSSIKKNVLWRTFIGTSYNKLKTPEKSLNNSLKMFIRVNSSLWILMATFQSILVNRYKCMWVEEELHNFVVDISEMKPGDKI